MGNIRSTEKKTSDATMAESVTKMSDSDIACSASLKPAGSNLTSSVLNSSDEAADSQRHPPGASASVQNSSTMIIDCDPCSTTGDCVEAVSYCTECKEYYCQPCYRAHSRSKATSNHTLLNQSTMPARTMSGPTPGATNTSSNINTASDSDNADFTDEFQFTHNINIKDRKEKTTCLIVAMVAISDTKIVVNDQGNKSVKKVDITNGEVTGSIEFKHKPFGITSISRGEVAITFPEEQVIRILSTSNGISVKSQLNMQGNGTAIDYYKDNLFVGYKQPVSIQILTMTGSVKKTIKPAAQLSDNSKIPQSIAVHSDGDKVYISDFNQGAVICLDLNGNVLSEYKDAGLGNPHGMTLTPFGSIYLCNYLQHVIYKMDTDLTGATVILTSYDGVLFPASMGFCPGNKALLIGSWHSDKKYRNTIKQFSYR